MAATTQLSNYQAGFYLDAASSISVTIDRAKSREIGAWIAVEGQPYISVHCEIISFHNAYYIHLALLQLKQL